MHKNQQIPHLKLKKRSFPTYIAKYFYRKRRNISDCNTLHHRFMVILSQLLLERRKQTTNRIMRRRRQTVQKIRNLMLDSYLVHSQSIIEIPRSVFQNIKPRFKACWMKPRSGHFWETIISDTMEDQEFIEMFRIKRSTFNMICEELYDELTPDRNAIIRKPVSVQKKIAIALYKMGSCCEYRVVGNVFGVHKSTVYKCLYQFVNAVNKILRPQYIQIPNTLEAEEIANRLETKTGMVQIYGAIDGTHIPILRPKEGYRDYVNRKGWPSMVLQCVVDDFYRFRDISIKFPGSSHDAVVFRDSELFRRAEVLLPSKPKDIDGKLVPLMLVGDPAYPLLPWLLKPYTGVLDAEEESFNCYLSSARIMVENSIGRLKTRWRCIMKRVDVKHTFVPNLVSACCVLHNIVETNKETFVAQWMEAVQEAEILFPQPGNLLIHNTPLEDSKVIRDHLKQYMSKNYVLRQSIIHRHL